MLSKPLRFLSVLSVVAGIAVLPAQNASAAETIYGALGKAYENNSSLNSARAGLRATNELVPAAKSGYRPRVTGTAGISATTTDSQLGDSTTTSAATFGIEIQQSIFDGFQTRNNVGAAEARVRAERQNLRNTEQNTLFDAAQVYMDVVQNRQIEGIRARNLEFLREQLRAAQSRFDVGEGTRTDVAQAQASLAAARAQLTAAKAATSSSQAVYRQIIGAAPGRLSSPKALSKLLPKSLAAAESIALANHPAILLRDGLVDAGVMDVKSAEGAFLPQVSFSAGVDQTFSSTITRGTNRFTGDFRRRSDEESTSATIGAQVRIPIYQGGQASANVRRQKELLGQARIEGDVARDQVRAAVTSSWTQLAASRASLSANRETLNAQQLALNGVIQERNVGQRTTLDVLNAQASVLDAQIAVVQAQRNLVVSSYALASAVGKLSAKRLGLRVKLHDAEAHYKKVKDAWYGLRTPDGR